MNNTKLKVTSLAALTCLIWASAFVGAKIGFEYMSPLRLSAFRFFCAGLILFPILLIKKYNFSELKGQWGFIWAFGLIQTFLQYGLFYYGLNKVPAAISAIVIGAGPLFVAILSHFLLKGERLNLRKIISIFFGLSGVAFISFNNNVSFNDYPYFYIGVLALISSNIIGSYTNIMVVKHKKQLSNIALISLSCILGAIPLYLLSIFLEPSDNIGILGYDLEFYLAFLWLAAIPAIGFSVWYYLLKLPNVKVSELNIIKFLIPVFGVLLSWLFIENERPDVYTITGIIVIALSVIILQIKRK